MSPHAALLTLAAPSCPTRPVDPALTLPPLTDALPALTGVASFPTQWVGTLVAALSADAISAQLGLAPNPGPSDVATTWYFTVDTPEGAVRAAIWPGKRGEWATMGPDHLFTARFGGYYCPF